MYRRLASHLRDDITSGRIPPGHLLPSETTLSQTHGVSRLTARAAVNLLRAEGLAELVRGRGVVVREPNEYEDLVLPPGSSVIARAATVDECDEYGMSTGTPVFSVTATDGTVEVFPADRWRLVWPSS
uniref:GntR family transcriptional regulator n=1 Tax=Paractinoplanes polyasparticus TaxID=2856853 RepID=UPI001C855E9A|nr:winged helix-turn-helix domain-containing protein [Actinoplanes polyasparticus]